MKAKSNPFLVLLFLASASHGADSFWDANGATAGVGGTGNWSANVWRDGSITSTLGAWVDGNRPVFPDSAVSVGSASDTAPAATGLPSLAATAWEYRTFKLDASEGLPGKGFLRAKIEVAP
jgi:hypothetical protein